MRDVSKDPFKGTSIEGKDWWNVKKEEWVILPGEEMQQKLNLLTKFMTNGVKTMAILWGNVKEKPKVYIATPCYDSMRVETCVSLIDTFSSNYRIKH